MTALAVIGMVAGVIVGQVGAFQLPDSSVRSAGNPVLSSYWSPKILRWESLIVQEGARRSMDPDFIASLMWQESRGEANAIGPGGSVGLMQIMPKEAGFSWRPAKEALLNPTTNVFWGTRTLATVIQQGDGDVFHALAAYNGGWDKVASSGPRSFAATILRDYAHAVALRCGVSGRWVAFFAVETRYIHGPIWVADSARADVYFFGQTNVVPEGTELIPNVPPTSVVARFVSAETGVSRNVGIWLYNVAQNTWDGCAASGQVTAALPPTAVPTALPTSIPAATPMPTATPAPVQTSASTAVPAFTATPWFPTPTFTPLLTPKPGGELAAALDAVVLERGAELRPGATLWWNPSTTLPAGTALRVLGYDPATPDWVYVGTLDDTVQGWTRLADLKLSRALKGLPLVTPIPTLTPTPTATPTPLPTPTVACAGGPLWAEAWSLKSERSPLGGWTTTIYARGYGGSCEYTYVWNVDIEKGPTFGAVRFNIAQDRFEAIVGTITVYSGDEKVTIGIHVPSPP